MGMIFAVGERWNMLNAKGMRLQTSASRRVVLLHSVSKSLRIGLQVAIYALGAYLAITNQSSAGIMIASSIIMGRALAPLDQAMASCKQSLEARSAYRRIRATLKGRRTPRGELSVEGVVFVMNGAKASPCISNRAQHSNLDEEGETRRMQSLLRRCQEGKSPPFWRLRMRFWRFS